MRHKAGHTSVQQGKRVLVVMENGNHFVAKFQSKSGDSRIIRFYDHDPVRTTEIRTLSIYKGQ